MDQMDLINRIEGIYQSLSKGQKKIANYIQDNYDKAAFMTAGALGRTVGVSESTVVRFASALGFEGYPKLQKHLQEIIKNKLTTVQRLNLMEGMDLEQILDNVFKIDVNNLKSTRNYIDVKEVEQIIQSIENARNIYIMGFRSSAPLAQFFFYYLSYIFENVRLVTYGMSDIFGQLMHVTEEDTVIGISFPRYCNQTVEGMEFAKSRNANLIAITDNKISPLYKIADHVLLTQSDMNSFVDSFVAPLSVINALIIVLGLKNKDKLEDSFGQMEELWSKLRVYSVKEYETARFEKYKDKQEYFKSGE